MILQTDEIKAVYLIIQTYEWSTLSNTTSQLDIEVQTTFSL